VIWRLAVIGSPIAHSRSPQLHEAGLRLVDLEGASQRVEVTLDDVDTFIGRMGVAFDAVSVTMPLKAALAERCHWRDESATRLGVINSLRFRDGQLEGRATDGPGFLNALYGEWGYDVAGRHVLIEGTGGSATALVDACVHAGVRRVTLVGRNAATRSALASRWPGVVCEEGDDSHIDLIVTTTPAPGRDAPRAYAGVDSSTYAVDITYNEAVSPWMAYYAELGLRTMNGLPMLAYQAVVQMQWWWGVSLDGHQLLEAIS